MAADWNPTTIYALIGIGVSVGIGNAIDKQLNRFQIANGHNDPHLVDKLSNCDQAMLDYLAQKLADAVFAAP